MDGERERERQRQRQRPVNVSINRALLVWLFNGRVTNREEREGCVALVIIDHTR